ncbi:MAG: hypothetical protein ABID09_04355 [Candidatus Omnitrophota bacterium]
MPDEIKAAYEAISSINKEAYKDIFLISNQVLSKNPVNNDFISNFLNKKDFPNVPWWVVTCKLFTYYAKSFLHLAMYLLKFLEYYLSGLRFYPDGGKEELIAIDICFIIESIKISQGFHDFYFPGLEAVLKKKNKHFAYIPFFYSASYYKRPFELYDALRILKKEKVPIVTEFQMLSLGDLRSLLIFMLAYPFRVLRFSKTLERGSYKERLIRHELIETLGQVTFYSFSRYLLGKRLLTLPYEKIKLISWYENQPIHKNLYMGLRTKPGKASIYGAQLFLHPRDYLYILPDEDEQVFGVIPDKIIANGPSYIPEGTRLNYALGPSLRSAKVFDVVVKKEDQKNIVVLLPCFKEEADNILQMLSDADLRSQNILLKAHPALPVEKFMSRIPPYVTVTNEDTYKLFKTAKAVVSAASSVLVEAASIGIPSISVKGTKQFDYSNPLSEYGKGIIWEEVKSPEELRRQIEKIEYLLENEPEKIRAVADKYKSMFFCEATEENIEKAFEL